MSYDMELEPLEAREAFNDSQKEIKLKEVNKNYAKYLTITKNEVHTKYRAIVRLPLDEYKVNDNEMLNKEDFEMIAGDQSSYSIPGTFEIEFPEEGISLNIFLPYNVNPNNTCPTSASRYGLFCITAFSCTLIEIFSFSGIVTCSFVFAKQKK